MSYQKLLDATDSFTESSEAAKKKRMLVVTGCVVALVIIIIVVLATVFAVLDNQKSKHHKPSNPESDCKDVAELLMNQSLDLGDTVWSKLAHISDQFGHRLSGSKNLEDAIDYMIDRMKAEGLENVKKEPVNVTHWVRGKESLELISSPKRSLAMLGLGGSIGTNGSTLTAFGFVVNSFDELHTFCSNATGKIVIFNEVWTGYSSTVVYRTTGAVEAAKCGAVAALVRSVTDFSIYTPHTGSMGYQNDVTKIPTCAITVEDALMFRRMQDNKISFELSLYMEAETLPLAISHNIMGEVTGENPNEVIVIGGHIDSWDVGEGSMDDLGGFVVAWEAVRLIQNYFLNTGKRPLRTIRAVGWTNEENGAAGARQYQIDHQNELTVLAIESDSGVFQPSGIGLTSQASPETRSIIQKISEILISVNSSTVGPDGGGVDVSPLIINKVPIAGLDVDRRTYFWYHHTNADTPAILKPNEMNACVATFVVYAHCVASLPQVLPRNP